MAKISVVTACYNAEAFIEATLRSVLDQGFQDLEYIVIDGGSKDGTLKIIDKYRDKLAYFASEPDAGQYHAIQKGMTLATGDVLCWLNADDLLMPWSLSSVSEIFDEFAEVDWVIGRPSFLRRTGELVSLANNTAAYPRHFIANGWYDRFHAGFLQQENMFWRSSLWRKAGGLDLKLKLAADYALWTSFAQHAELVPVSVPLGSFRRRPGEQRSSVNADDYFLEVEKVKQTLPNPPTIWSFLAQKGLVSRNLTRLAIYKKAPALVFDDFSEEWKLVRTRRSLSRLTLSELILRHAAAGAAL